MQKLTLNFGHDVGRARLSSKLEANGYDLNSLHKQILNHPTIKELRASGAVQVTEIIGDQFRIGCVDSLLSEYRAVNACNKGVTVVQTVNNICNNILASNGFKGYGKTQFWKNYPKATKYKKIIRIGADILTVDWIKNTYSRDFDCKLNHSQQKRRYK